jgi:hypothetical protein
MSKNVLIPEEQALVPFYGGRILAARLYDRRMAASMSSLCKMLSLAKHGQMERIRRNEEWLMSLDRRVAGMQRSAESAPEPGLSAAHLVDMRTLFRLLEQTTGSAQAQLTRELIETVRVSAIDAIPDRLWSDVLTWCWWRAQQPA